VKGIDGGKVPLMWFFGSLIKECSYGVQEDSRLGDGFDCIGDFDTFRNG
jgi:hypothetical protein